MTEKDILDALKNAYKKAGTQSALAKIAGISQGRIADYLNNRYFVGNMTVSTLLKLFPEIELRFFDGETANKNDSDALFNEIKVIWQGLSKAQKYKLASLANELQEETSQKHVERKAVG